MQRLFSMFPRGLPGFALLLLRISVGCGVFLSVYGHRGELATWLLIGSGVLTAAIFIGFLTPLTALFALAVQLAISMSCNIGLQSAGYIANSILNALALSLLGPGSFSIDAYRFGRRVVDLPPSNNRDSF